MKAEVSQKRERLSDPISIIAHQLKNPIAVIKTYIEVLLTKTTGPLTLQQEEYLHDVESNVKRMRDLVGKLLDVSRIEESRFELSDQTFDLYPLVEDAVKDLRVWAKSRGSEIRLSECNGQYLITSDPLKIRDVVENFISNAIKYNPSSKGVIDISLSLEDDEIVFRCKDNGIGVSPPDENKLFTKFYRSQKATELDSRGTGLGLYLSKAIIEQSGGSIGFHKNKDRGMLFYFHLPYAQ